MYETGIKRKGKCGENVFWQIDYDGNLIIDGTGPMSNWNNESDVPWHNLRNFINNVSFYGQVTTIGNYAFKNCKNITNITVPESVTSIGVYSFGICNQLTDISLHDNITSVGNYAFAYCPLLTNITIPDSVTDFGIGVFCGCQTLTNVSLPKNLTAIGRDTFNGCSKLETILIPNSVTDIGRGAFRECTMLKDIKLPDNITDIEYGAFWNCKELEKIKLPNKLINIDGYAFVYCTALKELTLSTNIKNIGEYAFYTCTALKDINYYGDETNWENITIASGNTPLLSAKINFVTVPKISINYSSISLEMGKTLELFVSAEDEIDISNITWSSSDTNIAVVDDMGVVTAINAGDTVITATTGDGINSVACTIKVLPIAVESLTLDKTNINMYIGDTDKIVAKITPDNATNKSIVWESSDTDIVYVENGVVTAKKPGTAIITAKSGDGRYKAECIIEVTTIVISNIIIDKSNITLKCGEYTTIMYTTEPENATDKTVVWSSSDDKIASVSNGIVKGIRNGIVVITASNLDGSIKAECTVSVIPSTIAVTGITLKESTALISIGEKKTLHASILPNDATNADILWSSNNNNVITVSDSGVIEGVSEGKAIVTAKTIDGGFTADCEIEVSGKIGEKVHKPISSIISGYVEEGTEITLISPTKGATIYYTTDGNIPTENSTKYTAPIVIDRNTELKTIAVREYMNPSDIESFYYQIADSSTPLIHIIAESDGKNVGDEINVSVIITGNSGAAGGSLNLVYENENVELLSATTGDCIRSANPIINTNYRDDSIRIVWASTTGLTSGGIILNAKFKILNNDRDAVYFTIDRVKIADIGSKKITSLSRGGVLSLTSVKETHLYNTNSKISDNKDSIDISVATTANIGATMMIGVYDEKGKMISVQYENIQNVNKNYSIAFKKPVTSGQIVKVFVWNSLNSLMPMSSMETISVK